MTWQYRFFSLTNSPWAWGVFISEVSFTLAGSLKRMAHWSYPSVCAFVCSKSNHCLADNHSFKRCYTYRIQQKKRQIKRPRCLYQPDSSIIQLPSKEFTTSDKQGIAANSKINSDHKIKYNICNAFFLILQKPVPAFSLALSSTAAKKHSVTPLDAMEFFKTNTYASEMKMWGRNAGSSEG